MLVINPSNCVISLNGEKFLPNVGKEVTSKKTLEMVKKWGFYVG